MQETWIESLDWEDPLEKGKATHSSILTWIESLDWEDPLEKGKATHSSILTWRIPGLYSPWGHKESDTTEQLSLTAILYKGLGFLYPQGVLEPIPADREKTVKAK